MTQIDNFDLSSVTTFHISALAASFIEYSSIDELKQIILDNRHRPIMHIGAGSNLLFTDKFDGIVLHSNMSGIEIISRNSDDTVTVRALSGTVWDDFVKWSVDNALYGAENLSAIPGEVGASAIQNIGAYGVEVKDIIQAVNAIDTETLGEVTFSVDQLDYSYRHSIFKTDPYANRYIITSVDYRLSKRPHFTLTYGPLIRLATDTTITLQSLRQHIIDIRESKLPDPSQLGNAGSFFKNPIIPKSQYNHLLVTYPDMPGYVVDDKSIKVPAGWLIERAGLKGASIGGAMVYPRQCLVIVNHNNATSTDVMQLCKTVQDTVSKQFDIDILPEVIFV